jgi:Ca2+-transporting ATPase
MKGAPALVATLAGVTEAAWQPQAATTVARGQRVLGVAQEISKELRFVGLLGLEDAVRDDSKAVVGTIRDAGIRIVMVTGDNAPT